MLSIDYKPRPSWDARDDVKPKYSKPLNRPDPTSDREFLPDVGFRLEDLAYAGQCLLEELYCSTTLARAAFAKFLSVERIIVQCEDLIDPTFHSDGKITLGQEGDRRVTFQRGQIQNLHLDARVWFLPERRIYCEAFDLMSSILPTIRARIFPGLDEVQVCVSLGWAVAGTAGPYPFFLDPSTHNFAMVYFTILHSLYEECTVPTKSLIPSPWSIDAHEFIGEDFEDALLPFDEKHTLPYGLERGGFNESQMLDFYREWKAMRNAVAF